MRDGCALSVLKPPNVDSCEAGVPQSSPQAHPHGEIDPNREYKLKAIVREHKFKGYLISWEDDEATGEKFEDSWEPKENANQEAIDDWERQKAEKKSMTHSITC